MRAIRKLTGNILCWRYKAPGPLSVASTAAIARTCGASDMERIGAGVYVDPIPSGRRYRCLNHTLVLFYAWQIHGCILPSCEHSVNILGQVCQRCIVEYFEAIPGPNLQSLSVLEPVKYSVPLILRYFECFCFR